jgi:hypothetical protein
MRGSPFPVAFMPDTNYAWLQRDPAKTKSKEGLAVLNSGNQPNMLILLINEVTWPFCSYDLFLQAKEKQTLRSALFVNPPDEFHLQTIQRHLDPLV